MRAILSSMTEANAGIINHAFDNVDWTNLESIEVFKETMQMADQDLDASVIEDTVY
jgi:hypothetical protein